MSRWALALLLGCGAGCTSSNPGAEGPRIKAAMTEINDTLHRELGRALLENRVDWSAAAPLAQRYAALAADLPRVLPEKGSRDSWQKLSAAFAADAERLQAMVVAHNKIEAYEAYNSLKKSCPQCHSAHR